MSSTQLRFTPVSKQQILSKDLDRTLPVISITDGYSGPVAVPNAKERGVLHLSFLPGDHLQKDFTNKLLQFEQSYSIYKFIKEQLEKKVEKIYIQCGEGRIRSHTLCESICSVLDGSPLISDDVTLKPDRKESAIAHGIIDRTTLHRFRFHMRTLVMLSAEGQDLDSLVKNHQATQE